MSSQGELYLPASVIQERAEEMAEELAKSLARQDQVPFPVIGSTKTSGLTVNRGIDDARLLREIKSWAAIALTAIENRVQTINWFAARRTVEDDKVVFVPELEGPANEILQKPSPVFSAQLLRRLLSGLLTHTGQAYLQIVRDSIGVPRELWPIPNQYVRPVSSDGLTIGAYEVRTSDGQLIHLPPEDVIRVFQPNPEHPLDALGALEPQATQWDAQSAMNQFLKAFFEKDATPRVAIIGKDADAVGPPHNSPEMQRFAEAWRNANSWSKGGTELGIPAFIPPGFDVKEFSPNLGTTDTLGHDERWSKQIMAAYGVPLFAVGIDTNTNRATGETTMWAFDQNTIKPITDLISAAITDQLMVGNFGADSACRFEDFVAPDKQHVLAQERQDLALKVRSVNEVRDDRGEEAVDWGDLPVGSISDEPYSGEPSALGFGAEPAAEPREREEERQPRPIAAIERVDFSSPEAVWARQINMEKQFVAPWARNQARVFEVQRLDSLRNLANVTGSDIDEQGNVTGRARNAAQNLTESDIFITSGWKRLFDELVEPFRREIMLGSAAAAYEEIVGAPFSLVGTMGLELERQAATYVTNINRTTQRAIAAELVAANAAGEAVDQIAKRVSGVFRSQQTRSRLRTIARTEVGMANQSGILHGFRTSGVVTQKVWRTSLDGAVRDSHIIEGQVRGIDEPFELRNGVLADSPLDRSLPPGDLINCRCFVTSVVEGDE